MTTRRFGGRVLPFRSRFGSGHIVPLGVVAIYECIECGGPRDVEMSRPGPNYVHTDWCPVLLCERREARRQEHGWIAGS